MRIALLTNGIPPYVVGGMQTHSYNMARQLARLKVDVDLYHPVSDDGTLPANRHIQEDSPEECLTCVLFQAPRPRRYPGHYIAEAAELSSRYLDEYLRNCPADLIYAKGLMSHAFLAARKRGCRLPPIVTNIHGYEAFQRSGTATERLRAAMLRPAFRRVIVDSDYVVSYGGRITELLRKLGICQSRILEVPGAVSDDILKFPLLRRMSERHSRVFAFVGRYERRKGLEELSAVLRTGVLGDSSFQIIGPVPPRIVKQFPMSTVMHGQVTDRQQLARLLDDVDVLICPSRSEGMPNVILEAMARRTAVIATDVGATRILVDSRVGWLIPPGSPDRLHSALRAALEVSNDDLEKMQVIARQRIDAAFTWHTVGRTLLERLNLAAFPAGGLSASA
ncbi:MAG: glycosyltransferase family 4 protein [Planctomycetaceae bacterium]|nr:glycosyltransferase family 4 protein [Planctomycetaceae bacterium]